jgi:microsomal dipeptidase-like Zn-dependent dipeptidase
VVLEEGDIFNIPTGIFRGFENIGTDYGMIMAILGGDDAGGGVIWAPQVIEDAQAHGLVLSEEGKLYDTKKGAALPDGRETDACPDRRRAQGLSRTQPADVVPGYVARYWDLVALADRRPVQGDRRGRRPARQAGLRGGHRHARQCQETPHSHDRPSVLMPIKGHWRVTWPGGETVLAPGDTMSVPENLPHAAVPSMTGEAALYHVVGDGRSGRADLAPRRMIPVFDGHNDALLRLSMAKDDPWRCSATGRQGHVDLPKARAGGMVGGFFALFSPTLNQSLDFKIFDDPPYDIPLPDPMPKHAAEMPVSRQVDIASALEAEGLIRMVRTRDDRATDADGAADGRAASGRGGVHRRRPRRSRQALRCGAAVARAGLVAPQRLRPWCAVPHGLRRGHRARPDGGGPCAGAGMQRARNGRRLQPHHDEGFWDIAEEGAPLVATHSNACAIALTARNLTDAQLKAVGETGGMVGLNFGTMFLRPDGKRAPEGGIDFAIRHLAHMVEMAGEDHVGLGSDFDGRTDARGAGIGGGVAEPGGSDAGRRASARR